MAFKDVYQVLELANRESAAREQSPERDTPTLTPIDRLVWVALAHHKHHNTGLCCPGYERLMRVTGLGRTTLSASLQRLKNQGRISVERHGRASRYSWEFPELPEALPDDEVREANFSSSRNELQKAVKRTSEVRETASNRVFKTGTETGREAEAAAASERRETPAPPPETTHFPTLIDPLTYCSPIGNYSGKFVHDVLWYHMKESDDPYWVGSLKKLDFVKEHMSELVKQFEDGQAKAERLREIESKKAKKGEKSERDTSSNSLAKWQRD